MAQFEAGSCLRSETLDNSRFRNAPDDSAISLDKREFVSKASFKQDGYAMMTGKISRSRERNVLSDAHMGEPN